MSNTKTFHEILIDYTDEQHLLHLDGYLTDDLNAEGFTIAVLDLDSDKVIFFKNQYRGDPQVLKAIEQARRKNAKPVEEPQAPGVRLLCPQCFSQNIDMMVTSSWNIEIQKWIVNDPKHPAARCHDCNAKTIEPMALNLDLTQVEISYEEWDALFMPIKNELVDDASWNGLLFETYGDEEKAVKAAEDNCIWTLVDDDDGNSVIVSGWHWVNRLGYFMTKNPFNYDVLVNDDD